MSDNGNGALTVHKQDLPDRTYLGDRREVAAIRARMASMMQLPPDVPDDVIWATAQLAAAHKLNPFTGEIYVIDLGYKPIDIHDGGKTVTKWIKDYKPFVGIKGLRAVARRQANFMIQTEVMEAAEVAVHRRENYDERDIGVRCTLYRLDVARECKDLGIPYQPSVGLGFWREKASYNKKQKEWKPDNIPNTWSAQMVAEKRAEVNAIKLAFDLELDIADPAAFDDDAAIEQMQHHIVDHDRDTAMPVQRQIEREPDGDILFP